MKKKKKRKLEDKLFIHKNHKNQKKVNNLNSKMYKLLNIRINNCRKIDLFKKN